MTSGQAIHLSSAAKQLTGGQYVWKRPIPECESLENQEAKNVNFAYFLLAAIQFDSDQWESVRETDSEWG